ncbi:crabs claw [Micractinium conductrix]|uniref:Crabs claw n=1 Tax=Micractinium conductrix TaxID=554055 RepID=A0A2P6V395_9CHLO|nr:crabs claw [Micractinium conductrix]|eukprot:PSC68560.1 crabs claw [Micractinium conductrix]
MDAFSMLAAPVVAAASNGSGHNPAQLIGFFAQEMQQFFAHIQSAVAHYSSTGEMPASLFGAQEGGKAGGKRKLKDKKAKQTRKPSAFNMFMKERMEQLKAAGIKGPETNAEGNKVKNPLFSMAASDWGKLTAAEKEAYKAKCAAKEAAAAGGGGGGAPASSEDAEESEDEAGSGSGSDEESESSESESEEEKLAPVPVPSPKRKKHKH